MNKNLIIGIVAAVVIGGGAVAYVATRGDDDDDANNNNTISQSQNDDVNAFNPLSTEGLSVVMTITSSNQEGEGVFEFDGEGNSRYVATQNGQAIEFIITSDGYFTKAGDQWIKYPTTASTQSGIDATAYQYDDSELTAYRNTAVHQGQQSCSAGTCDVWAYSAGGAESKIYIDTDTRYISQVETSANGQTSTVTYEYKDVTITPPTDYQELPSL